MENDYMQVIQQKLIWFLGCGSLLVILFRMDFAKIMGGRPLAKLKTGLILVTAGAAVGVISHSELIKQWPLSPELSFYIESLLGYFIGVCLIIWGAIEWSGEYLGSKGKALVKLRLRLFTEKASAIVLREHNSLSLLENLSKYLIMALDCQGLTLHRRMDNGSLKLAFQSGLTPATGETLKIPQPESLFNAAVRSQQIMSSDNLEDLHSFVRLEAKSGIVESGLSMPLISGGDVLGVFTALSTKRRNYAAGELDLLELISSALTAAMRAEKMEQDQGQIAKFREIHKLISTAFDRKTPMLTALVESAKIAYPHLLFDEVNLYVSDIGLAKSHDFALPEGGRVHYIEGHFTRSEYPHLYKDIGDAGIYTIPERQALIIQLDMGNKGHAWLEIRLGKMPNYLADLMRAWSQMLANRVSHERLEKAMEQITNWLGAIRFCQERALASDGMSGFLQEMATMVIDLGMATYCRISLTDPLKLNLKTIALAQAKPLKSTAVEDEIPTAEVETLRKVLMTCKCIEFDQEKPGLKVSEQESRLILPAGVRHGLILPLAIKNESVGLMVLGEFEGRERALDAGLAVLFASNMAALISMVLTWHKDKRISQEANENKRKLKITQREPRMTPNQPPPILKSQLNDSLAGILASCEYLRNIKTDRESEVKRHLEIIERNATQIHEITAGAAQVK
jgi:transcriptional regulator with GAF, ATPase, and Fis domain